MGVTNKNMEVSNENLGVSKKNLTVSNENMGVSNKNQGFSIETFKGIWPMKGDLNSSLLQTNFSFFLNVTI